MDYKGIYKLQYKNLPQLFFILTILLSGIIFLAIGIILASLVSVGLGCIVIMFGLLVSTGIAAMVRAVVRVNISQSVVVADTLLEMNERQKTIGYAPAPAPTPAPTPEPARSYTPPATASAPEAPAPTPTPGRSYTPPAAAMPKSSYASAAPAPAPAPATPTNNSQKHIVYKGHNADLYVYENRIVIIGTGFNKHIGEKTIPMKSITAVQFKPSSFVNGYITFNVLGEVANSSSAWVGYMQSQVLSENTVVVKNRKDDDVLKEIKNYVESIIYS